MLQNGSATWHRMAQYRSTTKPSVGNWTHTATEEEVCRTRVSEGEGSDLRTDETQLTENTAIQLHMRWASSIGHSHLAFKASISKAPSLPMHSREVMLTNEAAGTPGRVHS